MGESRTGIEASLVRVREEVGSEAFPRILRGFEDQLREGLQTLPARIEREELGPVERIAHQLASNAGTLGADDLATRARVLERLARGGNRAAARSAVDALEEVGRAALREIRHTAAALTRA